MTKLRNIVGVAFVAMSLLSGFAINAAHAENACQVDPRLCVEAQDERETLKAFDQ
jgi:hypothetical protein